MQYSLLEAIPYELLHILQIYLNSDNSLCTICQLGTKVYNDFIKDVQNGNIFVFDTIGIYDKVIVYVFTSRDLSFSTTSNHTKHIENNLNLITREAGPVNIKDLINDNKSLVYYRYAANRSNINELYIGISQNNLYRLTSTRSHWGNITSNPGIIYDKWKDLWDTLELQDKNAVLFQNGYPMIE
jgi:hypothetical protein